MRFVEGVLQDFAVLPFTLAEAREHARIWARLTAMGANIGERDLLIAATALASGLDLATLNHGEFVRVPGLALVDLAPCILTPRSS